MVYRSSWQKQKTEKAPSEADNPPFSAGWEKNPPNASIGSSGFRGELQATREAALEAGEPLLSCYRRGRKVIYGMTLGLSRITRAACNTWGGEGSQTEKNEWEGVFSGEMEEDTNNW